MRVRWTRGARDDLTKIIREIAKDRPDTAQRVANRIRASTAELVSHPPVGRVVEEFGSEHVRERVMRPWRTMCRAPSGEVHMLALAHAWRTLDRFTARLDGED